MEFITSNIAVGSPGVPHSIRTGEIGDDSSLLLTPSSQPQDNNNLDITLDSLQIVDPTSFTKPTHVESRCRLHTDELTEDETLTLDSSLAESSPGTHTHILASDDDESNDAHSDDDDEEDVDTNDNIRNLLKQAQKRLEYQSVYEEVKLLRSEVSQYRYSVQDTLRQKLELKTKCTSLENKLLQANESIQSYKFRELQHNEEIASREKEYMNSLNDVYSQMQRSEEELMAQIIQRDAKIIGMRNRLNEEEIKRHEDARKEGKKSDASVARIDINAVEDEVEDDDDWSVEEECCDQFI